MASQTSVDMRGLEGVVQKMKTLPGKLQRSGLRKAARRAMNIVRDAAKANAKALDDPKTAEKVWKNIATQESAKRSRQEGGVVMRVGVRGGAGSNQHSKEAAGNPGATGVTSSSALNTPRQCPSCARPSSRTFKTSQTSLPAS
ncbi:phage-like protein [Pseudomonas syringae pv. actinidiae ICMP 19071]|nr:phage-like protein [Pseudomonas syringae pv. actinidiae ICMP 19071]